MNNSNFAPCGMVVTPHHLASQSALTVLRDGGTAMEAMVSAAATISVVYPHMNGLGGDGFWLIVPPSGDILVIEACGFAGSLATPSLFGQEGKIPYKGPKSALTVAGTVGGWREALDYSIECGYKRKSLSQLLGDAIRYADDGYCVTSSQEQATRAVQSTASKEFIEVFMPHGKIPRVGETIYQPKLAHTLKTLVADGLDSFYRGKLANKIASDLHNLGVPIHEYDLSAYHPIRRGPLRLLHGQGELYNVPPPAQGIVSLSILGILDKLKIDGKDEGKFIHHTVEATKIAFDLRDKHITDPAEMKLYAQAVLPELPLLATKIDPNSASFVGKGSEPGDTVWMGVADNYGFCVSFIQSLYHEFGSGVLLPKTGIIWHNRGTNFSLDSNSILLLKPRKRPFHTLNPAAAKLHDGRVMIYGTRGGDGQPQTQAAIFHRYAVQGMTLQAAVSAPRWLYGRICGDHSDTLKLESRFSETTRNYLKERGHKVRMLPDFSPDVGFAGAVVRHYNGTLEGAFDPRSDGSAVGY